ncbi:DUF6053 domain-containing protein [Lysobacter enzymogenes]|uniref:DUF6053 domain-containing protein n=1 Tax=Lysobacter enzymogenes TaxID=69 RepID=UPI003CCD4A30
MGGASAPMPSGPVAEIGPEGIGAEAPPTCARRNFAPRDAAFQERADGRAGFPEAAGTRFFVRAAQFTVEAPTVSISIRRRSDGECAHADKPAHALGTARCARHDERARPLAKFCPSAASSARLRRAAKTLCRQGFAARSRDRGRAPEPLQRAHFRGDA